MKTCLFCNSINQEKNIFCGTCGKKLPLQEKTTAFRNFIISIVIISVFMLLGGGVYYLIKSNISNLIQKNEIIDALNEEPQVSDKEVIATQTALSSTEQPQIKEETKEKLSQDQKRLIALFGYPEQFIIIFDEGNNNNRIDSWIYSDMEACFIFESGQFNNVIDYIPYAHLDDNYRVLPDDFIYGMSPEDVENLIGEKGFIEVEKLTGCKIQTYGFGTIICIFTPDNKLISVSRTKLIE